MGTGARSGGWTQGARNKVLLKVMTESLQNNLENSKLSKKEAGGDKKHVYFFTRPNHNPFNFHFRSILHNNTQCSTNVKYVM